MADANETKFRCTIKKMYNGCPKENGWFGCFAHIRGQIRDIRLVGTTTVNLTQGMQLDITAVPSTKYQNAYEVIDFSIVTKTRTGIMHYLASLPGVSYQVALSLVQQYGEDTLDMIKNNRNEIQTTLNLTDKQINALANGINNTDTQNTLRQFLPELSAQMIKRVKEHLINPKEAILDNPYVLHDIPGISFPMADAIALRLGIDPTSAFRVNHGLMHILDTDSSGNLYINLSNDKEINMLCTSLENLLNIRFSGLPEFGARLMAFSQIENSPITIESYNGEMHLYRTSLYESMLFFVDHIKTISKQKSAYVNFKRKTPLMSSIRQYELDNNITVTDEQRNAVTTSIKNKVSIITGGPGRGKTSVIDCIANAWPGKVLLLAPTGKAMNKLRTATNFKYETMTIDKLIVMMTNSKSKALSAINSEKTLVIIDESSMIDLAKAANMITYLDLCQLCFVGDIDQLPPISPGHVLKSMIESQIVKTSYLTIPLRNGGLILSNADKINANDINLQYDFTQMPFYPQNEDDQNALDAIIDQYNDERDNQPDITQIALLCPVRKGIIGTINLNITIQDLICPLNDIAQMTFDIRRQRNVFSTKGYPIANTIYGNSTTYTKFRIGDIVMCTKNMNSIETYMYTNNDYWNGDPQERSMGIFNGDCGRIIAYFPCDMSQGADSEESHDKIIVQFFDNRIVELDCVDGDFEPFELGYALTVHKSQGCEYDTVIYVSPKSLLNNINSGFASRNLVYTAVTRAKKRVVIMGSKDSLNACILNNIPQPNSNLAAKLK